MSEHPDEDRAGLRRPNRAAIEHPNIGDRLSVVRITLKAKAVAFAARARPIFPLNADVFQIDIAAGPGDKHAMTAAFAVFEQIIHEQHRTRIEAHGDIGGGLECDRAPCLKGETIRPVRHKEQSAAILLNGLSCLDNDGRVVAHAIPFRPGIFNIDLQPKHRQRGRDDDCHCGKTAAQSFDIHLLILHSERLAYHSA